VSDTSALAARLRNLFTTGLLSRRDGVDIQGTTRFDQTVEGREMQPYGFAARAKEGTVIFAFEGGDVRSPVMLYVASDEGVPELEEGDSALWTTDGGFVIARADGTVELNGKDLGGLTKTRELKTQLDKSSAILQSILTTLATPVPEPGNGSPSAFQAALSAALAGKTPGDFSAIESDKVSHGSGQA